LAHHINWLYRRQLDCLSATNLCYDKNITYTELYFLNPFFFKNYSVIFFEVTLQLLFIFKRRKAA